MSLLHKLHRQWCKTVIIVSHDMDEIAENCTRAAVFSGGKILASCTPKELFEKGNITSEAGLDVPFVAKLVNALKARGVEIDCDFKTSDFIEKMLKRAKIGGAGMRLTENGGQKDA